MTSLSLEGPPPSLAPPHPPHHPPHPRHFHQEETNTPPLCRPLPSASTIVHAISSRPSIRKLHIERWRLLLSSSLSCRVFRLDVLGFHSFSFAHRY